MLTAAEPTLVPLKIIPFPWLSYPRRIPLSFREASELVPLGKVNPPLTHRMKPVWKAPPARVPKSLIPDGNYCPKLESGGVKNVV
jgi:hypothetical protein